MTEQQLVILTCSSFAADLQHQLELFGVSDCVVRGFDCRCSSTPLGWDEVRQLLAGDSATQPASVLLLGGSCMNNLQSRPADLGWCQVERLENCFEIIADSAVIAEEVAQQAYLVTPGWLREWRAQIQAWGFTQETAQLFFRESCKRITLLDTGLSETAEADLAAFGSFVGLPVRRLAIAAGQLRLRAELYFERLRRVAAEQVVQQQNRRATEYAMALDVMKQIARSMHEDEVISQALQLYQMLFAAGEVCFVPLPCSEAQLPISTGFAALNEAEKICGLAASLAEPYQCLTSGQGFMLQVVHGDQSLGVFWIDGILLPEHLHQYLGLALDTIGIFGLALCNARSFRQLAEQHTELEQLHLQLFQQEKLASIGQLAAGVAHEINNPMGYVSSNINSLGRYLQGLFTLLDAYMKAEPALADAAALERINALKQELDIGYLREDICALLGESGEGIKRVKQIVQDLKDFSRQEQADWQLADLHQGLESTLNIVHNELKYKADVVREYGELPEVECVPSQLNQVFMNLLVNAAHAMERHGIITVRTGQEQDHVWIEVEDNGSGIAPEHLKRIFEPFFTTKPVGKGTGLGLSLSYGIVQKHGGRIEVGSEPGRGTRFRVWLPIRQTGR